MCVCVCVWNLSGKWVLETNVDTWVEMTAEILQEEWRHEGYTPLQKYIHTQSERGAKDGFLLNKFLQFSGGTG